MIGFLLALGYAVLLFGVLLHTARGEDDAP